MNAVVPTAEARPVMLTGGRIAPIIPQSMEDAWRLGKAICAAGMAPRGMEQPEKCMIAIMRGLEVGLTPMQALDKIAVVNGRPTIWGDGAMALVRGSGLCEFVNERIDGQADDRIAVCETKRRGEPSSITRTFSVAEAKEAGLWNKAGPWKQFPARMLQMRARAFALRDLYADVLGGLYLREEIEDEGRRRADEPPPAPPRREPVQQIEHQPSPNTAQAAPAAPVQDAEDKGDGSTASEASASEQDQGDVVSMESLLSELDERLAYATTSDDVEEGYTDFDAEALLSDYDGGVQAARALKAKHLERVPAPAAAEKPAAVAPVDDFPGNAAIAENEKRGDLTITSGALDRDPFAIPEKFKGGGHYQTFIRDAVAAAKTPQHAEDLRGIWATTKADRAGMLSSGQLEQVDIRGAEHGLQKLVTDKVRALEEVDESDALPPPAPRSQLRQEQKQATATDEAPPPASKAASDDPVAAYSTRLTAALTTCADKQAVDKFWFAEAAERDGLGADEKQRLLWKGEMQRRKADLPIAEG